MELKLWSVVINGDTSDFDDDHIVAARTHDEAFAIARKADVSHYDLSRDEWARQIETVTVYEMPAIGDAPGVRLRYNGETYAPGFESLTTLAVENGEA